jgi:hypothetical protein
MECSYTQREVADPDTEQADEHTDDPEGDADRCIGGDYARLGKRVVEGERRVECRGLREAEEGIGECEWAARDVIPRALR